MTDREIIHQYLQSLNKYLARLEPDDATEVEREIESHIFDVIDEQEAQGKAVEVQEILSGFGPPRQLAEAYVGHIKNGSPPPKGFSSIRAITRGASTSLYWITGVFGFLTGVAMLFLAMIKLWNPKEVGVWSTNNGNSFVVGIVEIGQQKSEELLGFWFTPLFLLFGLGILWLTFLILKAFKRS